jgi:ribosome-associated protein
LEHKAEETCVLDLRSFSIWTDFFGLATAQSAAHLDGLKRHVGDWAALHREDLPRPEKVGARRPRGDTKSRGLYHVGTTDSSVPEGDAALWEIIDLGGVVVHLMSREAREFYDLEKLWRFQSKE